MSYRRPVGHNLVACWIYCCNIILILNLCNCRPRWWGQVRAMDWVFASDVMTLDSDNDLLWNCATVANPQVITMISGMIMFSSIYPWACIICLTGSLVLLYQALNPHNSVRTTLPPLITSWIPIFPSLVDSLCIPHSYVFSGSAVWVLVLPI